MITIRVHCSLQDYLNGVQLEADGHKVDSLIISCQSRFCRMSPLCLKEELPRTPKGVEWIFGKPNNGYTASDFKVEQQSGVHTFFQEARKAS